MKLNQGTDVGVKKISHKGAKGTKKYLISKLNFVCFVSLWEKNYCSLSLKLNGTVTIDS